MFWQLIGHLNAACERADHSPFGLSSFGLESFPLHRDLSDAISANDPQRAVATINAIIDTVEAEICRTIDVSSL